jgi:uncharacterized cupin superfamily protein
MPSPDAPIHVDDLTGDVWSAGELDAVRTRLGAPAGARRIGVAIIDVAPGARATPAHSHADEDELFLVLGGDGLSWQSSGSRDVRTYAVAEGDVLFHPSGGDAHTLLAGPQGLRVLVVAEGSRTHITWLPRTKQFWLGPRWSPADTPPPFAADAALPPIDRPEPTAERPPSIVALADVPLEKGGQGRFRHATRDAGRAAGARRIVLAHDRLPAGCINGPNHWHTHAEEAFYVAAGSGTAVIGGERHPLRPGSFFLRPPGTGVAHRIEVGDEGMDLVTVGDKVPGDVCVYPDSRKIAVRPGVFLPIADLAYFDGEPDAAEDLPEPSAD